MENTMGRMELVERLREKANISMEEAREVLEKNNWDLLDACVELEKGGKMNGGAKASTDQSTTNAYEEVNPTVTGKAYEGKKNKSDRSGRRLRETVRSIVRMSIDNKFVITRSDAVLAKVPVLVPVICGLANIWITIAVLFVGLLLGAKYSFEGKELGTEAINSTVEKATEAAAGFVNNLKDEKKENTEVQNTVQNDVQNSVQNQE